MGAIPILPEILITQLVFTFSVFTEAVIQVIVSSFLTEKVLTLPFEHASSIDDINNGVKETQAEIIELLKNRRNGVCKNA